MARMTMVQAINLALRQEMERDESVLVLGQDIGVNEGVFRVTAGLLASFGEERVIDTPLAEAAIVGTAIGMALGGLRPVAEIQFSGFALLALGQLEGNAARYRSRTCGRMGVPLVVRMPYGGGVRALEHHSESREAIFAHVPGLKVVIPSTPRTARALLAAAIRDPDPVIFMEPKKSYRAFREEVPEEPEVAEIGRARIVQEGTDLAVVTWGAMLRPTLAAVEQVQEERGASIEVIDLQTISPLDREALVRAVERCGRMVVVQEAPLSFGPASEVVAAVNDGALMWLEAPVRRISSWDINTPYFAREEAFFPGVERIRAGIEETLDF